VGGGRSGPDRDLVRAILVDTLRSPAVSALPLGLALGMLTRPGAVFENFHEPLFRALLSLLMLLTGMEALSRMAELREVAHVYVLHGLAAPFRHGLPGLAFGLAAHHPTDFSAGGVALLATMAGSRSDVS